MQAMTEFSLHTTTVVCPTCNSMFATPSLQTISNINPQTKIEADLHRVLPDAAIRAALIAICPACDYAWWITAFKTHIFRPEFMPQTQQVEYAKKFAHAILTGRKNHAHSLDLSLLALNGIWCARESGLEHNLWLELAQSELEKALQDNSWFGNRSYYHYIAGEIVRQLGDFPGAINHFNQVGPEAMLPKELVERQKTLAIAGDPNPALLPLHLVQIMFCPQTKPDNILPILEVEDGRYHAA